MTGPSPQRRRRQRIVIYGVGALVVLVAGCYGWHPLASAPTGAAAALLVAFLYDEYDQARH